MVGGSESDSTHVTSGVPQGSVLGPTLFLIYINFVAHGLTCKYKIFADDLKIYQKINKTTPSLTLLDIASVQRDVDLLVSRAESWGSGSTRTRPVFLGSAEDLLQILARTLTTILEEILYSLCSLHQI